MKKCLAVLGFCLSSSFVGYAQQSGIVRVKIPAQYNNLYNDELIKRLIIRPDVDRTKYIFAADTIVKTLEVCGGNGVYYFGRSATNHTSANYRVVIKVGNELQYAQNGRGQLEHRQLVNNYYSKIISDKCVTYDSSVSLKKQVVKLIEINNVRTSSNRF
ncbi:hypothetical protein [Hymenobacter sp. APR13]|uniref:hypothetical protein n=1 Tax=Hymenobacter sp. APR13 TaxID=1356852 RepID=UPI0012E09041|nr:hypothetical protein [Hymenobacter sp. APR13]